MNRIEIEYWLKEQYPLTVISDRYGGTYSGGRFLAYPCDFDEIGEDVNGGDNACMDYWDEFNGIVGKGATIEEAVQDLRDKLQKELETDGANGR